MTRISAIALAFTTAWSTTALADDNAGTDIAPRAMTFELGVLAGPLLPSDDHEFYDAAGDGIWEPLAGTGMELGLRAGFFPLRFLGLEAEAAVAPLKTKGGDGATLMALRVHAIAQYPARITPFAVAGATMMSASASGLGDDTDSGAYFGLGAKLYASHRMVFRLDGRLNRLPAYEPTDPTGTATNHFEVLLGASWTFGGSDLVTAAAIDPDPDHDGFNLDVDNCPEEPGVAPDGCPTKDTDGDGMVDRNDDCPEQPETVNKFEDEDGCPDEIPDPDGDGIDDLADKCPGQPEDIDQFEDDDGCPDTDNDEDGVTDDADNCPSQAGVVENKGCPDTDGDSDGVVDRLDNCPEEAGSEKHHGCKKKQLVQITDSRIQILDKVFFRSGKAKIQRRSNKLLDNVAEVLLAHPEIKKVRIEGHTDDRGDDETNKQLSQQRADAVLDYLVIRGISADRLEAIGYGEEKPIDFNNTDAGREANRRVEFNIVQ